MRYLPNTTVMVDPFEVAIAFMENAMQNGVELGLCQKVRKIEKLRRRLLLYTQDRQYETRFIVNAAGVHADDVAAMAGIHEYQVEGRHGNLCVLDKVLPIHTKLCSLVRDRIQKASHWFLLFLVTSLSV